jgi:hypothetical protein
VLKLEVVSLFLKRVLEHLHRFIKLIALLKDHRF